MQKKYAENYSIIVSFLHQTYKFIRKRAMTGQKFRQWSDDIKPEDDITPFDGTYPSNIFVHKLKFKTK